MEASLNPLVNLAPKDSTPTFLEVVHVPLVLLGNTARMLHRFQLNALLDPTALELPPAAPHVLLEPMLHKSVLQNARNALLVTPVLVFLSRFAVILVVIPQRMERPVYLVLLGIFALLLAGALSYALTGRIL
jgi:uncharacterized membrane protein